MGDQEGHVNVKFRVIKPLGPDKQRPTHYFLAVVGSGLQLGNNDPSKGQRALYIGDHVWERDVWVPKNTEVSYKWLVVQYYTNDIKDIETLPPRTVTIGDKAVAVTNRFNINDVHITELDNPSKLHEPVRGTNKPRNNVRMQRYNNTQRKDDFSSSMTSSNELCENDDIVNIRNLDDVYKVDVPFSENMSVNCMSSHKPSNPSQQDTGGKHHTRIKDNSYVDCDINTRITDVNVHGENVQVEIQERPGGPKVHVFPPNVNQNVRFTANSFKAAVANETEQCSKMSVFKTVVKTAAFAGAVVAGANVLYSCYKLWT